MLHDLLYDLQATQYPEQQLLPAAASSAAFLQQLLAYQACCLVMYLGTTLYEKHTFIPRFAHVSGQVGFWFSK